MGGMGRGAMLQSDWQLVHCGAHGGAWGDQERGGGVRKGGGGRKGRQLRRNDKAVGQEKDTLKFSSALFLQRCKFR